MADIPGTFGKIETPDQIKQLSPDGNPVTGINNLLSNIIGIFFAAAGIAFILMFAWGAVQMILSGGDKEAIGKARSKITWAIIGVTLLSLSYFIFLILQNITGFNFFI